MNCIKTKENIEALLDGELDDRQKDAVEHHLWVCSDCRELREKTAALSNLLRANLFDSPSADLNERVMKSFKNHHAPDGFWRRIVFGAFIVPKLVFATLLILASAGFWAAYQIGRINSTVVSMSSPAADANELRVHTPGEAKIKTVVVEVPVIKEKTVTRTVYVRAPRHDKNEKIKSTARNSQANNPLSYGSTVAESGFFTDVNLQGFEPSAEMNAKIIKEVKENEK